MRTHAHDQLASSTIPTLSSTIPRQTPIPRTKITTRSDANASMWKKNSSHMILNPMNASNADIAVGKYLNSATASLKKEYRDRSPTHANTLDEYVMKRSAVTLSTAGIESVAKATSTSSMTSKHRTRGVAIV